MKSNNYETLQNYETRHTFEAEDVSIFINKAALSHAKVTVPRGVAYYPSRYGKAARGIKKNRTEIRKDLPAKFSRDIPRFLVCLQSLEEKKEIISYSFSGKAFKIRLRDVVIVLSIRPYRTYKNSATEPPKKEFDIAVTFCGEHRKTVKRICNCLVKDHGFSRDKIFFDEWHEVEINGVNADVKLMNIYKEKSKVVVVFLSSEYNTKPWTGGIEWRAIRILINEKNDNVCLLNVDDVNLNSIDGLSGNRDIAHKIFDETEEETANFISAFYDAREKST